MTPPDNQGFALYNVELEYRGSDVLTRTRPMAADLPQGEPVMNPRGVLLERASNLIEVGAASMMVLTCGQSSNGEPLLEYFGYMDADRVPVFVKVKPTSLYDMADTLLRVSLLHLVVDDEGYHENTEGHEVLFVADHEGALQPLGQGADALWPQALLDAVQTSPDFSDAGYRRATARDVRLDTPYRRTRAEGTPQGNTLFECFVVCRTDERPRWLRHAKTHLREGLQAGRDALQSAMTHLDTALTKIR